MHEIHGWVESREVQDWPVHEDDVSLGMLDRRNLSYSLELQDFSAVAED